MKIVTYRHNFETKQSLSRDEVMLLDGLSGLEIVLQRNSSAELRDGVLSVLMAQGWSKKISISNTTKISITSIKNRCGLCLQTGNMARFYADFLKLQYLFNQGQIDRALLLTLTRSVAVEVGSNLANYERVTQELNLFGDIISVPMLVIGMEN